MVKVNFNKEQFELKYTGKIITKKWDNHSDFNGYDAKAALEREKRRVKSEEGNKHTKHK